MGKGGKIIQNSCVKCGFLSTLLPIFSYRIALIKVSMWTFYIKFYSTITIAPRHKTCTYAVDRKINKNTDLSVIWLINVVLLTVFLHRWWAVFWSSDLSNVTVAQTPHLFVYLHDSSKQVPESTRTMREPQWVWHSMLKWISPFKLIQIWNLWICHFKLFRQLISLGFPRLWLQTWTDHTLAQGWFVNMLATLA